MKRSINRFTVFGVLMALVFIGLVHAEAVGPETALRVARSQIEIMNERLERANYLGMPYSLSVGSVKPLFAENKVELIAYVFELEPRGFIVVTANTDLVPVIAYSSNSSFPWEEHPLNLLLYMLRGDLAMRIQARELIEPERISRYHAEWEDYISGQVVLKAPGDSWPPQGQTWTGGWVESLWHQSSPYWNKCPIDPVTSDRCVVGCVATVMGQIMNFWQYPDSVIFTHADDYVTYTRGISIDATTASIPYIEYNYGSPSDEVCADISFACGVSVNMNYTSTGSGASHDDAANAYRYYFDFTTAQWWDASNISFYSILEQNMKDSMPAQLGIYNPGTDGAHSVVCDGFRETTGDDEWHLNFGWGSSNPDPPTLSWYVLPEGMPAGFSIIFDGILNIESPRRPEPKPDLPVADFSGTPTSGVAPLTVNFTDLSTGAPTSWSWDFGDGGSSTDQNPSYTYNSAGTYTVSLTATNTEGSDTETKTDYITVTDTPVPPAADFSGTPTSGAAPLTVNFTDLSTGAPTSWSWDFGDGGSSTDQNPSYTYNSAGTYTVSLTATNTEGSDTETKTDYITVTSAGAPLAQFSANPSSGYVPLTRRMSVQFTDESTNDPTSWSWDFGDGGASTEQNPTHVYTSAGDFIVRLTTTNEQGSGNTTDTIHLYILPGDFFTTTPTFASITQNQVRIGYGTPVAANTELSIYDTNGRLIKRLFSDEIPAGEYEALWDLRDENGIPVRPGVYFVRLKASQGHASSKIIVTR